MKNMTNRWQWPTLTVITFTIDKYLREMSPFLWTIIISCIVSISVIRWISRWEVKDHCSVPSICTVCDLKIKKILTLSYEHTEHQRQRPMLVNGDTWEWIWDRFSSVTIEQHQWRLPLTLPLTLGVGIPFLLSKLPGKRQHTYPTSMWKC